MKTSILHTESKSSHWHCNDLSSELVSQSNFAVLSDETSTSILMTKLKSSLWKQEFLQSGRESSWKNMEQENKDLGSTDKDWQCCPVAIANGSLKIKYKCCRMRIIFSYNI